MSEEIIPFVIRYGYIAVFILIFLQEVGFPNPVPNEVLLIFSGYLCYSGSLKLFQVISVAFLADFSGALLVYCLFYYAGSVIVTKKPNWIPVSGSGIEKFKNLILKRGISGIVFFRCTPFTRGYVSVVTGLVHFKPGIYIPIVGITGMFWASIYILTGYFSGPMCQHFIMKFEQYYYLFPAALALLFISIFFVKYLVKRKLFFPKFRK